MILGQLVRDVARRLRRAPLHYGHGTTNARDEAAFLVLRGLGLAFDAPADRPVTNREQRRIRRLLQRRIGDRIPVPYLLHEAWLAGEGRRLRDFAHSTFYSDSHNDLPLLARVTRPVAVDPDEVLAAEAGRRGWPVISLR